jgi:hypothetical protein
LKQLSAMSRRIGHGVDHRISALGKGPVEIFWNLTIQHHELRAKSS